MRKIQRILFVGALILIMGVAACAPATQAPISNQASTLAAVLTSSPIAAATQPTQGTGTPSAEVTSTSGASSSTGTGTPAAAISMTPGIPVTGSSAALLICQFCLDQIPYAIVAIPENATFNMVDANGTAIQPGPSDQTGCENVQTFNGRQIILCRGTGLETINLSVCNGSNNCVQFPVKLQQCPQAGGGGGTGAAATLPAGTATITPSAGNTNTPSVPTSTPTP